MDAKDLHDLVARVRQGDTLALAEWHRECKPQMVRIVRRAMRAGNGSSPLGRRVLAEARHLEAASPAVMPRDQLVGHIARRLSDLIVGRLPSEQAANETVPDR
jgi:hypothetical protein